MAYTYKPIGAPGDGEHLAHYGVKGMKWYQSLFTDDLTEAKKTQSKANREFAETSLDNSSSPDNDEYQFNRNKIQQNQALREEAAKKLTAVQDDFKKMQQQLVEAGGAANAPEYMVKEANKLREKATGIQNEIKGYDAEIQKYTEANEMLWKEASDAARRSEDRKANADKKRQAASEEAKATAAKNKANFKEEQSEGADRYYREQERRIGSAIANFLSGGKSQLERDQEKRLKNEKEGREAAAKAAKDAWENGGKEAKEQKAQADRDNRNPFLELTKRKVDSDYNVGKEELDAYNAYDTLLKLTDHYGDSKDNTNWSDIDQLSAERSLRTIKEYSIKYPDRVAGLKSRKQLDEEAKEANQPKKSVGDKIGDFFKDLFKIKHDGLEEDGAALIAAALEPAPVKHHGIEGQKWGNRRFQNEDGSLTPEGYMRYYGKRRKVTERRRNSSANTVKRATAGVAAAAGIAALANRTHQLTKWRKDDRAFNRAANRLARAGYAPAAGHAPFQFDEKSLWKTVGAVAGTAAVVAGGSMIAKALKTKAAKREEEKARYDAYDRIQYERYKEELKQQGFGGSRGGTLAHWGIKEQKWGVRRYRNYDGTLTEEGKDRYYSGRANTDIHYLSNEELKAFTDRNNAEAAYKESLARNGKKAFNFADKAAKGADNYKKIATGVSAGLIGTAAAAATVYNIVERWKGKKDPAYTPKKPWWIA